MKITNNTFDISSTAENNDIHYPVYIFTSLPYIYTIIQNSIILSQVVLGIYLRSKQHIYRYTIC